MFFCCNICKLVSIKLYYRHDFFRIEILMKHTLHIILSDKCTDLNLLFVKYYLMTFYFVYNIMVKFKFEFLNMRLIVIDYIDYPFKIKMRNKRSEDNFFYQVRRI